MKALLVAMLLLAGTSLPAYETGHKMQHGFVLSVEDTHASHLVANGHHSWQANVSGRLNIPDVEERRAYIKRRRLNETDKTSYFLFQAQQLDLPSLKEGDVLQGHIVESKIGQYEPGNKVVLKAEFVVNKVLLNLINPFFL